MGRPRTAKPVRMAGAMACIPLIVAIWLRQSSGAPSAPSRFREQMREFTAFQPARLVPAVVFLGGMGRGARTRPPRRRRPKAGFRQIAQELLGRPGYYWLAQEWDNLFFACPLCNQRYKKNRFPLRDPAARARSHRDDVSREEPLFINPAIPPYWARRISSRSVKTTHTLLTIIRLGRRQFEAWSLTVND